MVNKVVIAILVASVFIILSTGSVLRLNVDAQNNSANNNSHSGDKTSSIVDSFSIITPWNTGIDRNNNNASNIRN